MWATRGGFLRYKRERNVPKTRNETRPSGGSRPLTVSRRSLPSRFLAVHTADEPGFDAYGRAPLGLRGGCAMPAMLSECVDAPQHRHDLRDGHLGSTGGTGWARVG